MSRLLVREVRKAGNGSDRRNISMIMVNTAGDVEIRSNICPLGAKIYL